MWNRREAIEVAQGGHGLDGAIIEKCREYLVTGPELEGWGEGNAVYSRKRSVWRGERRGRMGLKGEEQ